MAQARQDVLTGGEDKQHVLAGGRDMAMQGRQMTQRGSEAIWVR